MKIAIIQATSQSDKNALLEQCLNEVVDTSSNEIINFGTFPGEAQCFSYVEIALMCSFLLESKSVDFIVTGCSSGQGMMLACNSLPGILCGYAPTPQDAYLFGQINNGNAVSLPLGLNFGWAGELNLKNTLRALFEEPFGIGYPRADADRKIADSKRVKEFGKLTKRTLPDIVPGLDTELLQKVLSRKNVFDYIKLHGQKDILSEIARYI